MPKGKAQKLTQAELDQAAEITEEDIERAKKRARQVNPNLGPIVDAKTQGSEEQ